MLGLSSLQSIAAPSSDDFESYRQLAEGESEVSDVCSVFGISYKTFSVTFTSLKLGTVSISG